MAVEWRGRPRIVLRDLGLIPNAFAVANWEGMPDCSVHSHKRQRLERDASSSNSQKLLEMSETPWVIIGRLELWNRDHCHHLCSFGGDCVSICDDTGVACCLFIALDPSLLGTTVVVTSFNFIPSSSGGSCIEAREACALENAASPQDFPSLCISPGLAGKRNDMLETPPFRTGHNPQSSRLGIAGLVHCLSPSFTTPCKRSTLSSNTSKALFAETKDVSQIMKGFFVELKCCEHHPHCRLDEEQVSSDFREVTGKTESPAVVHVYFGGPVGAWHPVLLAAIGKCVVITGLRKKLIDLGSKEEFFILAATRTSIVRLLFPEAVFRSRAAREKRLSKMVSYSGVVTQIQFRGNLVELDGQVQLLLTHQQNCNLHGLRVGAVVSARNVHLVVARSLAKNFLLFGACFRSIVRITSFSPFDSPLPFNSRPCNIFRQKIQHVPFLDTFCILQALINLQTKMECFYGTEDIPEMQTFARDFLQQHSASVSRDGLKEFLSHNQFCCLGEGKESSRLPEIPSLSELVKYIERDPSSFIWSGETKKFARGDNEVFLRRIVTSDELNILLLGSVKACEQFGVLQLRDGTGSINVIVPDLHCISLLHNVYAVSRFTLVVEGVSTGSIPSLRSSTVCRNYYIIFHLKDASPFPALRQKNGLDAGRYSLLMVTYKYPLRKKALTGELVFFAEAVLLPETVVLGEVCNRTNKKCVAGSICHTSGEEIARGWLEMDNDSEQQPRRILLGFSSDSAVYNQVLEIGHCYAHRYFPTDRYKAIPVSSARPLWSLCFIAKDETACTVQLADRGFLNRSFVIEKAGTKDIKQNACQGLRFIPQQSDAGLMCPFLASLCDIRMRFSPRVQAVRDIANNAFSESAYEGLLVSFCGVLETKLEVSDEVNVEVKDLHGPWKVFLKLDARNVFIPSALAPGVVASFHRMLLRNPARGLYCQSVPTTMIMIHEINEPELSPDVNQTSLEVVPEDMKEEDRLICQLRFPSETRQVIRCRVVSVEKIEFKWGDQDGAFSRTDTEGIRFPLSRIIFSMGCFVVDDGSGLAKCWTNGTVLVTALLGLQGTDAEKMLETVWSLCSAVRKHKHLVYESDWPKASRVSHGSGGEAPTEAEQAAVRTFLVKTRACHRGPLLLYCDVTRNLDKRSNAGSNLMVRAVETMSHTRESERLCAELELDLPPSLQAAHK